MHMVSYLCFPTTTINGSIRRSGPHRLVIATCPERIDLVLANQQAYRNGIPTNRVVWIEDLRDRLNNAPDAAGAYIVTAAELLRCQAHCHLNTTIVLREFYQEIGGLDEGLRTSATGSSTCARSTAPG